MSNSFVTPWTIVHLSTGSFVHGISQSSILDGLSFPSPGYLPKPGIKPMCPALIDGFFTTEPPGKPNISFTCSWLSYKWNNFMSSIVYLPGGSNGKESSCNAGYLGSLPGSGRSPGERNGNQCQYFCLENSMTEEPSRLQSVGSQSQTGLSD